MVIVLIWWRILPTDQAVQAFLEWWKSHATIADDSALAGEFLSSPLPAGSLPFASDDLSPADGSYRAFVNVGLWRDLESFYSQVGQYFNDDAPPREFEAQRRRRTILVPQAMRLGGWDLLAALSSSRSL